MGRAEDFLDRYRILEEELAKKYDVNDKTFGSPIVRFINEKEGREYKDKLNLCREIRNLLSHHAEVDGERIIEPSQYMTDFLQEVIDYLRQPPLAIDSATLYANILKASLSDKVQTVMKRMQRQGFSHVPVLCEGKFVGVFSISTVFSYVLQNGMNVINDEFVIGDFAELLPPEKHETESFRFFPPDATLPDVRSAFERKKHPGKRLAVVFITDNGSIDGRILAMLTPWDVIS